MEKKIKLCRRENYGGIRAQKVKYIVMHYTGNDGDTDESNANYFANNNTGKTSAHWFVDDDSATLSVPEEFVAYHCGGSCYYHPECRNANSIGVELCDTRRDGTYGFTEKTVDNALELVRELMEKYHVPVENVVRHYDVTHKICPAPFVGAGQGAWKEFKERLMEVRYKTVEEVPSYAKATVQKLLDRDVLRGGGKGLDLSEDMVRLLVMLDRAGTLERDGQEKEEA